MKRFARWLFMKTHHSELMQVQKYVKRKGDPGQVIGALDTLETLTLLVGQ